MKTHGQPPDQCYLCQRLAGSRCSACGQPLCEEHEQVGVSPQGSKAIRCPPCNHRHHQEYRRTRRPAQ